MSAGSVVRQYAAQADGTATRTGRRDYRIAAQELHALAERLEKRAASERHKKRRQRAQLGLADLADKLECESRDAPGDMVENGCPAPSCGDTWRASKRTRSSVTLTRKAGGDAR